jgi:hypothetical protein
VKANHKYLLLSLVSVAFLVLLADDSIAQCSMCKKIATDGTTTRSVANGLNKGILYMLAFPYAMLAFIFRKQIMEYASRFRRVKK